jgi:hypothetical protein
MRCIFVNRAKLKADAYCCCCRKLVGDSYVREIGNRRIYCDRDCYSSAVGIALLPSQNRATPAAETKGRDVVALSGSRWFGRSGSHGGAPAATSNHLRLSHWFVVS